GDELGAIHGHGGTSFLFVQTATAAVAGENTTKSAAKIPLRARKVTLLPQVSCHVVIFGRQKAASRADSGLLIGRIR
ncbi:hypothetical protein, partial [Schaalia hyovaginalis]|uniref:hypothetical protein n=1 Tax=Schaalia hyovaginalis TaxID=29316 RepID=UPI002A74DCB2